MRHLTIAVLLALAVHPAAQVLPPARTLVFEIGKADHDTREFALAPSGYRDYAADGAFVAGVTDPARDWPYVHPGPADAWAGSRRHSFRVLFGLAAAAPGPAASAGDAELTLSVLDVQPGRGSAVEVTVNGRPVGRHVLPPGTAGEPGLQGHCRPAHPP